MGFGGLPGHILRWPSALSYSRGSRWLSYVCSGQWSAERWGESARRQSHCKEKFRKNINGNRATTGHTVQFTCPVKIASYCISYDTNFLQTEQIKHQIGTNLDLYNTDGLQFIPLVMKFMSALSHGLIRVWAQSQITSSPNLISQ